MESAHAQDNLFRRADLMDQAGILVHKDDASCGWGVALSIQDQLRYGGIEKNIQVGAVLSLPVEAVETRTPAQPVV